MFKEKINIKNFVLFFTLLLTTVIVATRASWGIDFTDEPHVYSAAKGFINGKIPFVHDIITHQTHSFWNVPFVYIYQLIQPDYSGIYFFGRALYILLLFASCFYIHYKLQGKSFRSLEILLPLLAFSCSKSYSLTYMNHVYLFGLLSAYFYYDFIHKKSLASYFWSILFIGAATSGYPTFCLVALVPLVSALFWKFNALKVIGLTLLAGVLGAAPLSFSILLAGIPQFISTVIFDADIRKYDDIAFLLLKFEGTVEQIIVPLLLGLVVVRLNEAKKFWAFIAISIVAFIYLTQQFRAASVSDHKFIMMLFVTFLPMWIQQLRKDNSPTIWLVTYLLFAGSILILTSGAYGITAAAPMAAIGIYFFLSKLNSDKILGSKLFALCITMTLLLLYIRTFEFYEYFPALAKIEQSQVKSGAYKYLYGAQEKVDQITYVENALKDITADKTILFVNAYAGGYLMTAAHDSGPATLMDWRYLKPHAADRIYKRYFEALNIMPDYLVEIKYYLGKDRSRVNFISGLNNHLLGVLIKNGSYTLIKDEPQMSLYKKND
jgi:hypothetical protein